MPLILRLFLLILFLQNLTPTFAPSPAPTVRPTPAPTSSPTVTRSMRPSSSPTRSPTTTLAPTPTRSFVALPSAAPTILNPSRTNSPVAMMASRRYGTSSLHLTPLFFSVPFYILVSISNYLHMI